MLPGYRFSRLSMFSLFLALLATFLPRIHAQTAHFSFAQSIVIDSGLSSPYGVAVDGSGNVYIADFGSDQVLKETLSGSSYTQSTIADRLNNLVQDPSGVAVDASGNVYIADTSNSRVLKETLSAGSYAQSIIGSGLRNPAGVAVDASGNVYIADTSNSRVLKETLSGGSYTQSTIADATNNGLSRPFAVAVDGSGNVYIADYNTSSVLKETLSGGSYAQSTIGSGLRNPAGVAVDASGNVYIADTSNSRVLKETLSAGSYTQSIIGSGLSYPLGVAVDGSGNVYISDTNNRVLKETLSGVDFGSIQIGASSSAIPLTFTFDSAGTISVPAVVTQGAANLDFTDAGTGTCTTNGTSHSYAQGDTCTVDVLFRPTHPGARYGAAELSSSGGAPIATSYIYGNGVGPQIAFSPAAQSTTIVSGLFFPYGVAVDATGNVYIADINNNRVLKETLAGGSYTQSAIGSGLYYPHGVAVDASGNVYIADTYHNRVLKETLSGGSYTQSTIVSGLNLPRGVAVDASGNVYIADTTNNRVLKETLSGDSYTQSTIGSDLYYPLGVAVDASGNVYIADTSNNRVLKETLSGGTYTQSTIGSDLSYPFGVAVDGSGNVYIVDTYNNRVLKETLAGDSYAQSAIGSGLSYPSGAAVDGSGNVYIADANNYRVLKEDVMTPPSLSFAATAVGSQSGDSPQSVTVTNNGNAALTFPLPTTGTNPSVSANFAWDNASTCTQTYTASSPAFMLAAGASCTMAFDFIPTAGGSIVGGAVLTDNNLNASPSTTQTISLTGTGIHITLSPTTLTAGTYGSSYSQTITATGGASPYTYKITSGSLPAGLSLNSGGLLSGPPVVTGTFNFTITATDSSAGSGPFTGSQAYTLVINLVPQTAINYLIGRVQALYPGTLTSGQENSLLTELQQASSLLSKGKISGAISNLQYFINQVKDLQSSKVLTSAQAQPLIAGAQLIINKLQGA